MKTPIKLLGDMIYYKNNRRYMFTPWILLFEGSWTKKDLKTIIKLWKIGEIERPGLTKYKAK